jgi:predicted DCC family thiol-disulfide oxidoreductase YuxK
LIRAIVISQILFAEHGRIRPRMHSLKVIFALLLVAIAVGSGQRRSNPLGRRDGEGEPHQAAAMAGSKMTNWPDDDVILYDGVCIFCSRWVRFVVLRDTDRRFRFTPVQSNYGARLAQAFGIDPADPDTNAAVHGGVAYFKSDAALTVLSHLPGWRWTRALFVVPKPLRDAVYNLVARNRYRIFGKYEACFVPDAQTRTRVLE